MTSTGTRPTSATVILVIALIFADVTSAFETIMIYTAVKDLLEEYGQPETIGWLLSSYLLVAAGAAAICGRLGDMYGRRPILVIALFGTIIGSLISFMSASLEWVIVGRAIQGLSGAVLPLALGLARQHVPSVHLNMSVVLITASAALGAGLGMIFGGYIVDNFGWRHIFTASIAMSAIAILLCIWAVPKSVHSKTEQKLDLVGGLLFLPAIACVLLAISKGGSWNWDIRAMGTLGAGLTLLAVWVIYEARHPEPLLDVKLLKNRNIALTNILMAIVAVGVLHYTQLLLLLLQQPTWTGIGLGLSATLAAVVKAPGNFITVGASPLWGYLANRWGASRVVMLGVSVVAAACGCLFFFNQDFWVVVVVALVGTIGVAAAFAAIPTILVRAAPLGRVSETIGISSVIRSVGMAIGSQAMLAVLATSTVSDPRGGMAEFPTLGAYQLLFILMIGACAAAFVIAAAIPKDTTALPSTTHNLPPNSPPSAQPLA